MRRYLTAAVAVSLLAACTTASSRTASTPTQNDWLLVAHGPPATMAALLTGQLEIDLSSQCVRAGEGGWSTAVIFPAGTRLDASNPDHPAVVLGDGRRLQSGDEVEFGGGWVPVPEDASDWGGSYSDISVPPACHNGSVFWMMEAQ